RQAAYHKRNPMTDVQYRTLMRRVDKIEAITRKQWDICMGRANRLLNAWTDPAASPWDVFLDNYDRICGLVSRPRVLLGAPVTGPVIWNRMSIADTKSYVSDMKGIHDKEFGTVWAENVNDAGTEDGLSPATYLGLPGGEPGYRHDKRGQGGNFEDEKMDYLD